MGALDGYEKSMSNTHRRNPGSHPSRLSQAIRGILLASALTASVAAHAEGTAHRKSYHISGGSLGLALSQFARDAGILFTGESTLTDGKTSKGLEGEYTVEEGFRKLLSGSGLTYTLSDDNAVAIKVADTGSAATFAAAEETVTLKTMTVVGKAVRDVNDPSYQVETSTAGSKVPLEITQVPQGIQVITRKAIEDQGALSISNIMKQVPSATIIGSRFSRFPQVNIRGFGADQTRNGMRQIFGGDVDFSALSHIQSMEVLKGPGSTVFGQTTNEGGGVMNVITKRPFDQFASEFSFTRGGYDEFDGDITSGQWDINSPLTPDGALKVRFTGEIEGTESFIKNVGLDRENFGLALSWDNGGPIRAFINAEYQHRLSGSSPGLPALGTVLNSGIGRLSRDTFLGEPEFYNKLEAETPLVQAWLDIDVAKNWTISPRFQYNEFNINQDQIFMGASSLDTVNNRINVARSGRTGFTERDRTFIGQIDINGKLETGPLTHQIYLGGDYTKEHFGTAWNNLAGVPAINALNPSFLTTPLAINPVRQGAFGTADLWAFAFQDVISINSKFDLTGGVRHSVYTATRFTPSSGVTGRTDVDNTSFQVGGTFHATDSLHFFAGYGESFSPVPAVSAIANNKTLDPGEAEQIEVGVKVNFPFGLTGTASYFDITRSKVTTPDRNNPGFSIQTGEVRSEGAEVELAYQVTDQWYVQGGYAFVDAKITKSNAGDVGNGLEKIPEHQANIWTHYKFDSGILKNLTLSAGANYVGNRPFDNANTIKLPDYTTVDLGASYTYEKVRFELFANNVLDKRYFTSADFGPAVFPGNPRTIFGRVSVKF
jgi:iron complex outermembrane receptor protein